MSIRLSELEAQRQRLKQQLSGLGDLRPGSLVERYRKCGKPNCHCAQPGDPGHGPSWSLTHDVKGKTATRIVPEAFVPQTRAIQIVDRFHVKQTLHRTAQSIFGATERAKQWATARCAELDEGKLYAIVRALRPHAAISTDAARCRLYIYRNRRRMRYPQFHKQGICTSSGVLEAGCKVAIGTRLKRSGMHWTLDGANHIITLRFCRLSGRFEDFWERRNEPVAA
jgi:hypothetical protein